jgi:signal transduction histidine kinase
LQNQAAIRRGRKLSRQFIGTLALLAVYGAWSFPSGTGDYRTVVWIYLGIFMGLVWMPRHWRTPVILGLVAALGALGILVLINLFGMNSEYLALLLPFPGFLVRDGMKTRWAMMFVAGLVAATLLSRDGEFGANVGYAVSEVGIYLGFLGARLRREAHEIDQRRLKELLQAHEQLKEAHAELSRTHEELLDTTILAMQSTALAERASIARDIHDGVGHLLTSLVIQLQSLQMMLPENPQMAAEHVPDMLAVARQAVSDVRLAVHQWSDEDAGLGLSSLRGLAEQVARRGGISCTFEAPLQQSDSWSRDVSIALYRVLQESLTNVLRHANARHVVVTVLEVSDEVTLTIEDDGCYTGNPPVSFGFGLKHMQERCKELGGHLVVEFNDALERGMRVRAKLPLNGGAF